MVIGLDWDGAIFSESRSFPLISANASRAGVGLWERDEGRWAGFGGDWGVWAWIGRLDEIFVRGAFLDSCFRKSDGDDAIALGLPLPCPTTAIFVRIGICRIIGLAGLGRLCNGQPNPVNPLIPKIPILTMALPPPGPGLLPLLPGRRFLKPFATGLGLHPTPVPFLPALLRFAARPARSPSSSPSPRPSTRPRFAALLAAFCAAFLQACFVSALQKTFRQHGYSLYYHHRVGGGHDDQRRGQGTGLQQLQLFRPQSQPISGPTRPGTG